MIKVRQGVFETNSSSTHSIIIVEDDDYQTWEKGEKFFIEATGKFVDKEEAEKLKNEIRFDYLKDCIKNEQEKIRIIEAIQKNRLIEEIDEMIEEDGYYAPDLPISYNEFCNEKGEFEEQDYNTYITKNGDKIHIFCSYEYN